MLGGDVDVYIIGVRGVVGVCCHKRVLVIAKISNFGSTGVENVVNPCLFGKVGYGLWDIPAGVGYCEEC